MGRGGGGPRGAGISETALQGAQIMEEAKLHRGTLGLTQRFTQRRGGVKQSRFWGIKRWGKEGIRIGTSDSFGRGRSEY